MAQITQISAQKRRGRYNIFLDGEYAFPVSEHTLVQFMLAKGMAVDDALRAAIQAAEVEATANGMALDYLSAQMRTVHELTEKLSGADVPEDVIAAVVERLTGLGYLDDERYAAAFVHDNEVMGERGPKQIAQRLREKGIAPLVIEDALAEVTDEGWATVADRVAAKAARTHRRRAFHDQLQRIKLALRQHGFTAEQTEAAVAALDLTKDEDAESSLLAREAEKQWRLKARYSGYDRRNRVKQALYRKGFALEEIDAVLRELSDSVED